MRMSNMATAYGDVADVYQYLLSTEYTNNFDKKRQTRFMTEIVIVRRRIL